MAGRNLFACLLLSTAVAAAGADPKSDPKFTKGVEQAIARGVDYLLSKQAPNGKFPAFQDTRGEVYQLGMHTLATLAVMKGLGDPEAMACLKALRVMRQLYQRNKNMLKTYEAGLVLMVLDAKYHTDPRPGRKRPAKRKRPKRIDPKDLALAKQLVTWLQRKQRPSGLWRYPELGQDMSNSQYAALGLWSAHRLGVAIDRGVVQRMLEETLKLQQPKGKRVPFIQDPRLTRGKYSDKTRSASTIMARGWRYLPEERVKGVDGKVRRIVYPYSGSMTSSGIAILAVGRDILGKKDRWLTSGRDALLRKAMWEGLAWIQDNWDLGDNPGQPGNWPFYWIYGLERCARLSGVEYVGAHDWFFEGASRLLTDQKPNGAWPSHQRMRPPGNQNVRWWSDQVDTSFAILFLTRSTPSIETPPPAITQRSD